MKTDVSYKVIASNGINIPEEDQRSLTDKLKFYNHPEEIKFKEALAMIGPIELDDESTEIIKWCVRRPDEPSGSRISSKASNRSKFSLTSAFLKYDLNAADRMKLKVVKETTEE